MSPADSSIRLMDGFRMISRSAAAAGRDARPHGVAIVTQRTVRGEMDGILPTCASRESETALSTLDRSGAGVERAKPVELLIAWRCRRVWWAGR